LEYTILYTGHLRLLPQNDLHNVLDSLSQKFEEAFVADKPVWKIDKMPPTKLNGMMNMLAPIALQIISVDSTWKLAQTKPQDSREKVAAKMLHYARSKHLTAGTELAALSALHRIPFTGHEAENMYETTPVEASFVANAALSDRESGIIPGISYERMVIIVLLLYILGPFFEQ
jgi:hypothetical protein